MYVMDFVANFMENNKNFENRSTFVKLMNECIVAQFLLRHGVYMCVCVCARNITWTTASTKFYSINISSSCFRVFAMYASRSELFFVRNSGKFVKC